MIDVKTNKNENEKDSLNGNSAVIDKSCFFLAQPILF